MQNKKRNGKTIWTNSMKEYNSLLEMKHKFRVKTIGDAINILIKNQITPELEQKLESMIDTVKANEDLNRQKAKEVAVMKRGNEFLEKLVLLIATKGRDGISESDFTEEELKSDFAIKSLQKFSIKLIPTDMERETIENEQQQRDTG